MTMPRFKVSKIASFCALALLPTSTVYAGLIDLKQGLVAHYEFEGNWQDSSGNENHVGGNINTTQGAVGNAIASGGYNRFYIENGDTKIDGISRSVAFWLKPTENNHNWCNPGCTAGQVNTYQAGTQTVIAVTANVGTSAAAIIGQEDYSSSFLAETYQNLTPNYGEWTHYALTLEEQTNTLSLYVDGQLQGIQDSPREFGPYLSPPQAMNVAFGNNAVDELRFYNESLNELEVYQLIDPDWSPSATAKVEIDGTTYTVPITKGFYSEIRDEDGNVIEGGVDATVAARLYAASQMLYDIQNYNGQQLVDAQFENSIETQQAMIDARRWEAEARYYSAASVAAVTGSVAVAACTVGLTVPILGAVSCVGASAGWAIGNLVNIGANELQEASTSAQSTWIYDSGIALLDEMQILAPQVETSAASLIAKGQSGVLSYSEILDANLKVDMVRKHDEAVSNLFTAAPMDLDNAQLFLETVANGAAGVDPTSILGPTLSILSTVRDTDIKIDEYLELSGSLDMDGYYDKAHVSDSIISLYASIALDTGLAGSSNNNQQSVEQTVDNFDSGSLEDNWLVEGPGSASIEEIFVLDSLESVLLLETGSPISVAQELFNTPDSPFYIDFDYLFGTTTGQLDIYFNDLLLDSLFAADFTGDDFLTHTLAINDPSFYGLSSSMLEFYFDGDTGSQVYIDNISLNSVVAEVPEPESIAIFALGLTGLALGRRRRNSKH